MNGGMLGSAHNLFGKVLPYPAASARIAWARGGNADRDFQPRRIQKRTEIFKFFTIIVARNQTGSRRKIAD